MIFLGGGSIRGMRLIRSVERSEVFLLSLNADVRRKAVVVPNHTPEPRCCFNGAADIAAILGWRSRTQIAQAIV